MQFTQSKTHMLLTRFGT